MKKKLLSIVAINHHYLWKFHLTMRFCILFTCLFCFQLSAKVYSQKEIVLKFDNPNVKLGKIFELIESQTSYRLFYDNKRIPLNESVQIKTRGLMPVEEVLQIALKKFKLNFSILSDNVIIVSPNEEKIVPVRIRGSVKDKQGMPLPGVTVKIKSMNKGTVTDLHGFYEIDVPDNAILVFSYVGYISQEVPIAGKTNVNVILAENANSLDELVVVGYGTQKKSSTTAAISTLKGSEIVQNPVANINNSIAGRIPGVLAFQSSGEPGKDASALRVRGVGTTGARNTALTIVDGIPRDISQLNPNEIESITVLKDAAAIAPYGLAGANGVILITTKRGKEGKVAFTYDGWYGVQRPTRIPDYLDAYDFATTINIANKNAGLPPTYSDIELQKYKDHSDPDHYPDHNWVREVIDFNAPMTSHSVTFTGGSEKVRYFGSAGYLYQQGSVNVINYSRYNFASNVDLNATKTTKISLDVQGSLEVTKNPGSQTGTGIYTQVTKQSPLLSKQLRFSNGLPGNTLLPSIYNSGYKKVDANTVYTQVSVEQQIPVINGLSIKAVAAYDKTFGFNKQWQTPYSIYSLNASDEFVETKSGVVAPKLNERFDQNIKTTLQGYINYKNSFSKNNLTGLLVVEQRQGNSNYLTASRLNYQVNLDELSLGSSSKNDFDNSGLSHSFKQLGFVYRLGYDYSQKYLAEFSGRYDGHYFFAPGKRFAFFPAISLGWRLSEEKFIKDNFRWIDNLKLRGSYGKSGNLAGAPFQYLSSYGLNDSYIFGGSQVQGIFERSEPNPNITWETAKKLDIGVEGSLFKNRLGFEFDYFKEKRSDMLVTPDAVVPVEYGIGISQINAGIMENGGFDFSLTSNNNFTNGLVLSGGLNVSYAKNKLIQTFENASTFNDPNRRRTGRPLDTQFGLKAIGLFQSQAEIDASPKQFGKLIPGDIKYQDTNMDGKIDNNDEVVIGNPAFPQLIFGLTVNGSWKGFDLSMLWQGAAESSFQLRYEASNPFFNGAKIFREQLDYWTPDNPDASHPVILPSPNSNSQQVSSFWQKNGRYMRLKNLEVGYTIPKSIINRLKINSLRFYLAGQNVLTFSSNSFLDPEIGDSSASQRARYYFQQQVFTLGINVNF